MAPSSDMDDRLVALVNDVKSLEQFLHIIDPRRKLLKKIPRSDKLARAKRYLRENRFTDALQIIEALDDRELYDLIIQALKLVPWTCHPTLMLPLRLETRFTNDGYLMVRIYPDQIFVCPVDAGPTKKEYDAVKEYRLADDQGRMEAWRGLSSKFGPWRAARLARWAENHDFDAPEPKFRDEHSAIEHTLSPLPDRFGVFVFRDGDIVHTGFSNPVREDIAAIASIGSMSDSVFDDKSKWMHDFEVAVTDGMAVKIKLNGDDDDTVYDRVIAVGLKWTGPSKGAVLLQDMLDSHHFGGGLGFLSPGTPTNNTGEVKSSFSSEEDHDKAYDIEINGPPNWEEQDGGEERTNAHRLARGLGIDPGVLRFIEGAGNVGDSYAGDMNAVTWPVTGDYYLRYFFDPKLLNRNYLDHVRTHVCDNVRGGGPLPSIRVGKQPYGVLPVTRVFDWTPEDGGWKPWSGDKTSSETCDVFIHKIVARLFNRWLFFALDPRRVPRVGIAEDDPGETLLRILAMEPNSVSYNGRPFVDDRLIGWLLVALRNWAFGPGTAYAQSGLSPLEWMARWVQTWNLVRERIGGLVDAIAGLSPGMCCDRTVLTKIFAWWQGRELPLPEEGLTPRIVIPPDTETKLSTILSQRCGNSTTGPLLKELARRALAITAIRSDEERRKVYDAILNLSNVTVTESFNSLLSPEMKPVLEAKLVAGADKEDFSRWISRGKSELGGRFRSVAEIESIGGLSYEYILATIASAGGREGPPDIDRLFRESLDISSHRLDAWVTSFATKRLAGIRSEDNTARGVHLGAYGFVENLGRRADNSSKGFIHAPSTNHSTAFAVMHNAFLSHSQAEISGDPADETISNPFRLNLTSQRVRNAMWHLEGIRRGQSPGALLGYKFERALKENSKPLEQYIHDLREHFPVVAHKVTEKEGNESVETVAARNVLDGIALVQDFNKEGAESFLKGFLNEIDPEDKDDLLKIIRSLKDQMDAVGDLFMAESIYQAAAGNYERAGAAMEAASGNASPPEIESVSTPISGTKFSNRLCLLLNNDPQPDDGSTPICPRAAAEPRVTALLDHLLGNLSDIGFEVEIWEEDTSEGKLNINTAGVQEMLDLGLGFLDNPMALKIAAERSGENGLFRRVRDLARVDGIGDAEIDTIKDLVTTGYNERDLNTSFIMSDLPGLDLMDFFYIAQVPPGNEESEIEQRIRRYIRESYSLSSNVKIDIKARDCGSSPHCLENAIEFSRQLLKLLSSGAPMSPDTMCHPGEIDDGGYSDDDVLDLEPRVSAAKKMLSNEDTNDPGLIQEFDIKTNTSVKLLISGSAGTVVQEADAEITHIPTGTVWKIIGEFSIDTDGTAIAEAKTDQEGLPIKIPPSAEWKLNTPNANVETIKSTEFSFPESPSALADLLKEAAQFGVHGAFPPADDDPLLIDRFLNTKKELEQRNNNCNKYLGAGGNNNVKIRNLIAAMKAIFGKGFIVLPTFVPNTQNDALDNAFKDNNMAMIDQNRFRIWLQQLAGESEPAASLDEIMMMAEGWSQANLNGGGPCLTFKAAQLPFTQGRPWLALDDPNDGVSTYQEPSWPKNPLSLVVVSNGPIPVFDPTDDNGDPLSFAGILLDEWSEIIPFSAVETSVAFHYDAPGAQAPQSLLLAVPGVMKDIPAPWTEEALAQIVNDTIDLAKVRTVDIDALAGDSTVPFDEQPDPMGGILPAIYLPADPDKPGFARELAMNTLNEWVQCFVKLGFIIYIDTKVQFSGPKATHTGSGLVFESVNQNETLKQAAFSGRDDLRPETRGVLLSGNSGLKIILANPAPRVDLTAGWRIQISNLEGSLKIYDQDGNELQGGVIVKGPGGQEIRGTGISASEMYYVCEIEIAAADIKYLELTGACLVNLVKTYKLE